VPKIELTFDMPPSVNKLYQARRGGSKALTDAARQYREHVKHVVGQNIAEVSAFPSEDPALLYAMVVDCFFSDLENPGWYQHWAKDGRYAKDHKDKGGKVIHKKGELKHKAGDRKAKTRFKVIDADNRIKFLQDAVIKALGIPGDEQVFQVTIRKFPTKGLPRVEVFIAVEDYDTYFNKEVQGVA